MEIRSIRHRGLRRLIENDDPRHLPPKLVNRIRNILAALIATESVEGIGGPPGWRVHELSGTRQGTWSISTSGNWRITFTIEDDEISELDLEDYH